MTESTSDPLAGVCTPVTSLEASDAIHDPSLTQIAASVVPTKYHSSFKDRFQDTLSLPGRVIFISSAIELIFLRPALSLFFFLCSRRLRFNRTLTKVCLPFVSRFTFLFVFRDPLSFLRLGETQVIFKKTRKR